MIFGEPFETPFDMLPATIQYKTYSFDAIMAECANGTLRGDVLLQVRDTKALEQYDICHCSCGPGFMDSSTGRSMFYPLPGAPGSKAMHLKESLQWFCL